MKQGLQLRLSQQLAMTPQLQQAIRLLQLSLELQQEIQLALESNPLLEQTDNVHEEVDSREYTESETLDTREALEQKDMPEELPLDATGRDLHRRHAVRHRYRLSRRRTAGLPGETTQSLQDYLMWQVELTPFTDTDRAIATSIVDAIDDTGYLTVTLDEIRDSMGDEEVALDEVEAVLKRVQRFDPVGVGARDLRDCLLVQLSQFASDTPWLTEAQLIVSEHLDLLANHDFRSLMRVTRLKEDVLKEAMALIQSLDPRRGSR